MGRVALARDEGRDAFRGVPFYRLLVAGEAVLDLERDHGPVC